MDGSTKSTLQNHGGIRGCRFGAIGLFWFWVFPEVLGGVNGRLCGGLTYSRILRGVGKVVGIPTAPNATIFMSLA